MAKIMIADDSDVIREQLGKCLRDAGHEIIEAAGGFEAIELLEHHTNIDLLITDLNMPGVGGIKLIERLNEGRTKAQFAIFVISAEFSETKRQLVKDLGVKAWIQKPFVPAALLQAVSMVLKQKDKTEKK